MAASAANSRKQSTAASRGASMIRAAQLCLAAALGLSLFLAPAVEATGGLKVGYYKYSCPDVETIVYNSMVKSYKADKTVAPGVLRLAFHDCFVRGCDASVLLAGPNSERAAPTNRGLQGFEAVDVAKKAVEKACPGVVSASDVLQLAARDSAGGYGWSVPAGRRDGRVSIGSETTTLPSPLMDAAMLLKVFQSKGLNAAQLVILSGAHTIGKAPCVTFDNRLQTEHFDSTLAASFAKSLKKQCPKAGLTKLVNLDSTPRKFDTQYFKDIIHRRGLLTSDQTLLQDSRTKDHVYANSGSVFYRNFGDAMVAMSRIGVLTGHSGEIRRAIAQSELTFTDMARMDHSGSQTQPNKFMPASSPAGVRD